AWEQKLHTARAFLFVPIGVLLYAGNFGGPLLWFGAACVAVDFVIELLDVAAERQSRRRLGGISSGEYMVHIAGTSFRMVSLALIFAAKPLAAWSVGSPALLAQAYPAWLSNFALAYSGAMLAGAVLYVLLTKWPVSLQQLLHAMLPRPCPLV